MDLAQKCDAKRPCTRCVQAESTSECVYDNIIRSLPHSIVAEGPTQLSALTFKNLLTDDTFADLLLPAEPDLSPLTSDVTQVATYELATLQTFEAVQVLRGYSSELVPFRRIPPKRHPSPDTNPSISIISSFLPPTIPPELQIPLLFLGEERLQVSDADTTGIDMRWCVFGLIYTRATG